MSGNIRTPTSPPHGFGDGPIASLLRARPPAEALVWVEHATGRRVLRWRARRGGSSSAVHELWLDGGAAPVAVVMRRYVLAEVTDEEPDIVRREAGVLSVLERSGVDAPQVLAFDELGVDAGVPALLMTRIPGRVDWNPRDVDAWLRRLAAALVPIHAVDVPVGGRVQPLSPYPAQSSAVPLWLRDPSLWPRAVAVFLGPALDDERVFIHRDYHPGNVLWRRGRVTGVVDWEAARIGPRSFDVVYCKHNLLGRFGRAIADRFVRVWEDLTGAIVHPWSEAVLMIDAIGGGWIRREREQRDVEDMLARALAELGR